MSKEKILSVNVKKNCKRFFIRQLGPQGPARTQARPPPLFSPVFFVFFPLPSFSWPILSDTFYMNNYLCSLYSPCTPAYLIVIFYFNSLLTSITFCCLSSIAVTILQKIPNYFQLGIHLARNTQDLFIIIDSA